MQSLLEFSAIKSCPELSADYILLSDSPPVRNGFTNHLQLTHSYLRLSESEFDSSSNGAQDVTMTTLPDDTIEILSCHVDHEDDDEEENGKRGRSATISKKREYITLLLKYSIPCSLYVLLRNDFAGSKLDSTSITGSDKTFCRKRELCQ